jgi:hypothetical protein
VEKCIKKVRFYFNLTPNDLNKLDVKTRLDTFHFVMFSASSPQTDPLMRDDDVIFVVVVIVVFMMLKNEMKAKCVPGGVVSFGASLKENICFR